MSKLSDDNISINLIRTVEQHLPNLGVTTFDGDLHAAAVGVPVRLKIGVTNFGDQVVENVRATVVVDGEKLPLSVSFPKIEGGQEDVQIQDLTFNTEGLHRVQVQLEGDSLKSDNERYLSLNVPLENNVLIVAGNVAGDDVRDIARTPSLPNSRQPHRDFLGRGAARLFAKGIPVAVPLDLHGQRARNPPRRPAAVGILRPRRRRAGVVPGREHQGGSLQQSALQIGTQSRAPSRAVGGIAVPGDAGRHPCRVGPRPDHDRAGFELHVPSDFQRHLRQGQPADRRRHRDGLHARREGVGQRRMPGGKTA